MKLTLNPFENKKPGKKAEQEQKIEIELDEKIERMMEQYRPIKTKEDSDEVIEEVESLDYETLEPTQIDILLQRIIQKTKNHTTGIFLSQIIQKSYAAGHNNFTLTTKETLIHSLGNGLKGLSENPIQITIQGNASYWCGVGSENCTYNITGNTGDWCGHLSKNCTYNIQGNIEGVCGASSKNCTYTTPNKETYKKMLEQVPKGNKVEYTGK